MVLLSVGVVCFCSLPFVLLHCLLLGREFTVVFVGVSCDGLSGDEQMAHSQIVVVIAFSSMFEMDVALVFHWCPFGNSGFHCHILFSVYHHLFRYVILCF